ncbi:hypothetical protein [Dyadobacter koreensis]|nr:hypothetical protein [Dyadobacter koreensis]
MTCRERLISYDKAADTIRQEIPEYLAHVTTCRHSALLQKLSVLLGAL